jgi:hypothetical protein
LEFKFRLWIIQNFIWSSIGIKIYTSLSLSFLIKKNRKKKKNKWTFPDGNNRLMRSVKQFDWSLVAAIASWSVRIIAPGATKGLHVAALFSILLLSYTKKNVGRIRGWIFYCLLLILGAAPLLLHMVNN